MVARAWRGERKRMLVEAGGRVVLADVNAQAGEALAVELGAWPAFDADRRH